MNAEDAFEAIKMEQKKEETIEEMVVRFNELTDAAERLEAERDSVALESGCRDRMIEITCELHSKRQEAFGYWSNVLIKTGRDLVEEYSRKQNNWGI